MRSPAASYLAWVTLSAAAILSSTAASAEDTLELFNAHLDCAIALSFIEEAKPPRPEHLLPQEEATALFDRHMREVLRIGVPMLKGQGDTFSRWQKPMIIGGSAEAGIGAYFVSSRIQSNGIYELRYGAWQVEGTNLDARLDSLHEWNRLRAGHFQIKYDMNACRSLLDGSQ